MDQTRRNVLRAGSGASLLALLAAAGMLRPDAAFDELGADGRADSADIVMVAPEIAENGAVVPIGATSKIPGTESIAILIAKNPNPLAAVFEIPAGTEPGVMTRVKLAQTSDVYVLVKAHGKYYATKKQIKVTIGG